MSVISSFKRTSLTNEEKPIPRFAAGKKEKSDGLIENFTNRLWQRSVPSTGREGRPFENATMPQLFASNEPSRDIFQPVRLFPCGKSCVAGAGIGVDKWEKVKGAEGRIEIVIHAPISEIRCRETGWREKRPRAPTRWRDMRLCSEKKERLRRERKIPAPEWYLNALFASLLQLAKYSQLCTHFFVLVVVVRLRSILEDGEFEEVSTTG